MKITKSGVCGLFLGFCKGLVVVVKRGCDSIRVSKYIILDRESRFDGM